jgi:hypothetical protein
LTFRLKNGKYQNARSSVTNRCIGGGGPFGDYAIIRLTSATKKWYTVNEVKIQEVLK